ncbi:bifunctional serine/threonine-protein kinase/formylglycine-generating enzyme family protein [Planctomyces sp. SH-PL14]|uniref:bifunctional serine/threonine-protein kinase/formylglycine-generating enzyme family protein n=1 Tax=Planctomyces sp. SH-PL14 TaxID=1632864 RepID=UPI00078C9B45|nr:bifunctional serine/threonine-protein kinase/formylglycine-generating enzyme family protein [Planctomyces sp. SH-PL14]AMV16797.1 Serine/threonine-protein kinase PrkC [Planctomyces sp. SH-PL14]
MNNQDLPTGPVEGGTSVVVAGSGLSDLEIDLELNSVCDAFESALQTGQRPQLADYLTDTRLPVSTLFVELVQIEMEYRRRKGEPVTLEEYVVRYPEFSEALSKLAPSLDTVSMPAPRGAPTTSLGRFELVAPLGQGTFGVVWKARDTKLRRWVAIKRFRETAPAPSRDLFAREARAVQKLDHPNVVRLLELSQGATTDYIVFEYVEGRTLKEILEERNHTPLDPDRAARIALQLANGLQHIHERGLIHRDLKPANVMITPAGDAKFLDFGLARHTDTTSTIGGGQGFLGTIPYMSPEQLQKGKSVTRQSDIYALGTVLYEMLSSRRPFEGSVEELIATIPKGNPSPMDVPAVLRTIVGLAMEVDPLDRYASAEAMAEDLQCFLDGSTPASRIGRKLRKLGRQVTRRDFLVKSAVGIAATAGIVKAAGVLVRTHDDGRHDVLLTTQPEGAEVHIIPIRSPTGEPDLASIQQLPGNSPLRSRLLPGNYLVVAVLPESRRFHEVFRRVPESPNGFIDGIGEHQRWELHDGVVHLPSIKIPDVTVVDDMTLFPGSPTFLTGEVGVTSAPRSMLAIPSFYLDRCEVTISDYRHFFRGDRPAIAPKWKAPLTDRQAAPMSWDAAVLLAEIMGKRLMSEYEYEFAATNGGERLWSWGDNPSPNFDIGAAFQNAGLPAEDRVGDPPVYGLCSNLAEWTSSGLLGAGNGTADGGASRSQLVSAELTKFQIVRGGSLNVLQEQEVAAADRNPRRRLPRERYRVDRGLGLRCARSPQPRCRPEHFIQAILPYSRE